jgi:hypothetical protein
VIHGHAPLDHQFLSILETQGKHATPPHTGHNNDWLELALAEPRRPTGSHGVNLPDPQMQHFLRRNSELELVYHTLSVVKTRRTP